MYDSSYMRFLEKAMAPHSSTLTWRIPWREEPGGLQSMGLQSQTRLSDFTFTFNAMPYTSLVAQMVKNPPANAEDLGSVPGLGRSPGEGNGYPLQYSCLENPMEGEAW